MSSENHDTLCAESDIECSMKNFYRSPLSLIIVLSFLSLGCSTSPLDASNTEQVLAEINQPKQLPGQILPIEATAVMGNEVIELEVTHTPRQQALGLMFRESLPDNRGMLFSFEEPKVARFWMKNVKIHLDMVFLLDGKIQSIEANVPPCTSTPCPVYGPDQLVNQVIELRGGRAAELGLQVGGLINIDFIDSQ